MSSHRAIAGKRGQQPTGALATSTHNECGLDPEAYCTKFRHSHKNMCYRLHSVLKKFKGEKAKKAATSVDVNSQLGDSASCGTVIAASSRYNEVMTI